MCVYVFFIGKMLWLYQEYGTIILVILQAPSAAVPGAVPVEEPLGPPLSGAEGCNEVFLGAERYHINTRMSHCVSQAQNTRDTRNHGL